MSQLTDVRDTLRTAAASDVFVFPTDPGWDGARRAWNLAVDQQPTVVALPESLTDVVEAVGYARRLGLRIAVQGTGHGAPGRSLDGTMLVNTSRMTGVEVDPKGRTARVAAGTIWADVVEAAAPHGLAALHGSAHDVGVVGYSLGGGVGWLARRYGLASSSILSAQVVTADGNVLRADAGTNTDLFWALRGGGGSFGVVTELEFALYPVAKAYAGWLVWPMERATEVLGTWAEWTKTTPDEVTSVGRLLQIPPIPEMPEPLRGRQLVVVEAAFLGDEQAGRDLLRPLHELGPELDTFAVAPASALTELHQDPPGPVPARGEGWLLDAFDTAAARAVVDAAAMDGTAPLVSVEIRHLQGALGRPDPNGGALTHFQAPFAVYSVGMLPSAELVPSVDRRIAELRAASRAWLSPTAYFNLTEREGDPSTFYTGRNYQRLVEVRAAVDPEGVFRAKHDIG